MVDLCVGELPELALHVRRGPVAVRVEVDGDLDEALLLVASIADAECPRGAEIVDVQLFEAGCSWSVSCVVRARAGELTSSVLRRWYWAQLGSSDPSRRSAVRSAIELLADLLIDQAMADEGAT